MFKSFFKRPAKPPKRGDLSRYTLLRTVGKGSMSVVFKAKDADGKDYAIKVLQPETLELRNRLNPMRGGLSEGELAYSLQHPHIIHTVDYGKDRDGKKEFIVMELIEGILLKNLIGANAPEIKDDPVGLFIAIGEALSYVHNKGYIHRDFCPKNVFLLKDGRNLLFDFGLTISIQAASHTQGFRTGTASYMAPELIRRARTDQRTDIYSYGVTMYEVMTGTKPYGGSGTIERMIQLLNSEPRDPKLYNPDIPDELCEIFMKCLEKDPEKRFHTADRVVDRLRTFRDSQRESPPSSPKEAPQGKGESHLS